MVLIATNEYKNIFQQQLPPTKHYRTFGGQLYSQQYFATNLWLSA
jgi:acyl-CoA thioesterase